MHSNIPKLLADKKITVSELSKGTGLSRTTLTELSKSDELPKKTRVETLMKVSEYLHVPMKQLFGSEQLEIELIKNTEIISGEAIDENSRLVKAMRVTEPKAQTKILRYSGLSLLRVSGYNKPLAIAYDAYVNGIRFEVLGENARLLFLLLTGTYISVNNENYDSLVQGLLDYCDRDKLNYDLQFISEFGLNMQNEFLEQLAHIKLFKDLSQKVIYEGAKWVRPYFMLDSNSKLTYNPEGYEGEQHNNNLPLSNLTDLDVNINSEISKNIIRYILTHYSDELDLGDENRRDRALLLSLIKQKR